MMASSICVEKKHLKNMQLFLHVKSSTISTWPFLPTRTTNLGPLFLHRTWARETVVYGRWILVRNSVK